MFGWLRKLFRKGNEAGDDFVALVALLTEPRLLERSIVELALRSAGLVADRGPTEERPSYHRMVVEGFELTVTSPPFPYVDDPEKHAAGIKEGRLAVAFAQHRGCILVDCWRAPEGLEKTDSVPVMGRILAELLDETAIIVYSRVSHRMNLVDADLIAAFRAGEAAEAMDRMTYDGVRNVDSDSADIQSAMQEARTRWPEFMEAFLGAEDRGSFIVKGRFTHHDKVEWMWIEATEVATDYVVGTMVSKPFLIPRPRAGDSVIVRLDDLGDWCFIEDGEMRGGFVEKLLQRQDDAEA